MRKKNDFNGIMGICWLNFSHSSIVLYFHAFLLFFSYQSFHGFCVFIAIFRSFFMVFSYLKILLRFFPFFNNNFFNQKVIISLKNRFGARNSLCSIREIKNEALETSIASFRVHINSLRNMGAVVTEAAPI